MKQTEMILAAILASAAASSGQGVVFEQLPADWRSPQWNGSRSWFQTSSGGNIVTADFALPFGGQVTGGLIWTLDSIDGSVGELAYLNYWVYGDAGLIASGQAVLGEQLTTGRRDNYFDPIYIDPEARLWELSISFNFQTALDLPAGSYSLALQGGTGTSGDRNSASWESSGVDGIGNTRAFVLYGTAAPEPSTFALVGLGLGSLVLFRRRR